MDFKQNDKIQQHIAHGLQEKIKEALGGKIQVAPIKVHGANGSNEERAFELEMIKEQVENQTFVLNEIKETLEKLNHSVAKLNKANMGIRRIK